MSVASAGSHADLADLREATPHAIEVVGLTASLGGAPAVRNLSIRVPRGSVYGLVGPSGAGKTATLRVLATLLPPDSGTVRVGGIDVRTDPAAVRALVGYLPDAAGVYEHLSVTEYLEFYAAVGGIPAPRRGRTVEEVLELVNLSDRRDTAVRRLSRGMRQQLALGRCLIHDPQVLLLDEPASGMDPSARVELREILRELAALGKTVLLASSVLPEVAETCTHLGVMRRGELIAQGPISQIISAASRSVHLRVRLLDTSGVDAARKVLNGQPGCRRIEKGGERELVAEFVGTEEDVAVIEIALAEAGVSGARISMERPTLEEIVLGLIGGEGAT